MGIWEAIMMLTFGLSWPMAIFKTIKAKNPAGKSLFFAWLIMLGYVAGIINKFASYDPRTFWVVWLYVLNLVMVAFDTVMVYYYRAQNRKRSGTPCEKC